MKKFINKKIISAIAVLAVSFASLPAVPREYSVFSISASAAELEVSVTGGTVVPSQLKVGQAVIVKGTVNSSEPLKKVKVGVYDSSGKAVTKGYEKPNTKTYNLNRLDNYILFNKLPEGEYTYRIYVSTESKSSKLVVKQTFTVGNKPKAADTASKPAPAASSTPSADISNVTVDGITLKNGTKLADHIAKGKGVSVTGTITANKIFSYVTVAVYDINKKFVTGIKILPNVNKYDLANTDKYVKFNILDDGVYYYRVTAAFDDGAEHVIVQKKFAVGSAVLGVDENKPAPVANNSPASETQSQTDRPINISEGIEITDEELEYVEEETDLVGEEDGVASDDEESEDEVITFDEDELEEEATDE